MNRLIIILAVLAILTAVPAWFVRGGEASPPLPERSFFGHDLGLEVGDEDAIDRLEDLFGQISRVELNSWDHARDDRELLIVSRVDDEWRIESRANYPADGDSMVGKTAAQVLGVRKLRRVADRPEAHAGLGVLDPRSEELVDGEGVGRRVALTDEHGRLLVDLIIGSALPEMPGQYYAREAGSNEVWVGQFRVAQADEGRPGAPPSLDLSSRFIDWVKPGPFELKAADVLSLRVQNYSVDEEQGRLVPRSDTLFERSHADADWRSPTVPPGRTVDQDAVERIVDRIASLRLADVSRRRGLGAGELRARGFYPAQQGLFGLEGGLVVADRQGFTHFLFFGDVAGSATDAAIDDQGSLAADAGAASDRYLAVWVQYDQQSDRELPVVPPEPAALAPDADEAARDAHEAAIAARRKAQEARQAHLDERVAVSQHRQQRYEGWFFVIRDFDFNALRPEASRLFVEADSEETTERQLDVDFDLPEPLVDEEDDDEDDVVDEDGSPVAP